MNLVLVPGSKLTFFRIIKLKVESIHKFKAHVTVAPINKNTIEPQVILGNVGNHCRLGNDLIIKLINLHLNSTSKSQ